MRSRLAPPPSPPHTHTIDLRTDQLFVGVTIDKFVQLREAADGGKILLTFAQQQWVEVQTMMMHTCKPHSHSRKPRSPLRRRIYHLVTRESFEAAVMFVIFATIFTLCTRHANQARRVLSCALPRLPIHSSPPRAN